MNNARMKSFVIMIIMVIIISSSLEWLFVYWSNSVSSMQIGDGWYVSYLQSLFDHRTAAIMSIGGCIGLAFGRSSNS